jgi:ferric-dicitrate binding protein FerR (iron transport regulator)
MKSLDRHSLDEQTRLVSRYVAGDLSRSERAEFEAWLVASPELAAEVEMERRLRRGIASAARRGWLKRGAQVEAQGDRRWRMAVAASLVLALTTLGLSLVLPDRENPSGGGLTASIAMPRYSAPRTVRLGSVRGLGTSPDVTVARNDAPRELTIEPDVVVLTCEDGSIELECAAGAAPQTPQYDEYELELVNRGSSAVAWRSPRQVPPSGALLSFVIPDPAAFGNGDYDMIVRGHDPDHEEVVARFWLRVADK